MSVINAEMVAEQEKEQVDFKNGGFFEFKLKVLNFYFFLHLFYERFETLLAD
jgi:hypothetical protein